jgi:hypothetical protein
VGAYVLAGELMESGGDFGTAFAAYHDRMSGFVAKCQKIAEGADWFVPRTRGMQWLSMQMWRFLPYTPWKNLMLEIPLKIGNSISLKDYSATVPCLIPSREGA